MVLYFRNDTWDPVSLSFFERNKTILPVKLVPYTIRKVLKNKEGHYLLLLNEIENTIEVPIGYYRFSLEPECLLNNVIDWEIINELYLKQGIS